MGLYRYAPKPSGRMGLLWTLGGLPDTALLEFGSMGHMLYAERWLSQSGPINVRNLYTTHLDEKDIALGITKRFFKAIEEIIQKESPKVIFVLPSTVPSITGVDMEDLCFEAQETYNVRVIMLKKGSFHEKLHHGIEEGIYCLVNEFAKKETVTKTQVITYNLIGSSIDLEKYYADVVEIKRILKEALGMEVNCVLATGTNMDSIKQLGSAHINLVLRKEGIKAANVLKEEFHTEYVYGRPYGYQGTVSWLQEIATKLGITINNDFVANELKEGEYSVDHCKQLVDMFAFKSFISIGGNYDAVKGILEFATKEVGFKKKIAWCDVKEYEDEFLTYQSEEDLIHLLSENFQGILMGDKASFIMAGRKKGAVINRSLDSKVYNLYESPYVGFRGAMNLCSIWIEEIMSL